LIAAVVNAALIMLGSLAGILFRNRISDKYSKIIMLAMALCVALIGIKSAVQTADMLCVIICMAIGTLLGEALKIEHRIDRLGDVIKGKVLHGKGGGRFTEGFMAATLLFCVGSMAVMGSMEAGINHDYDIIFSKSVIDCIVAVTFAAAMGVGVVFSGLSVLVYQGALTLLFILLGPFIPESVLNEMSAVGGLLILGVGVNMLGVMGDRRIPVGNMLPAMFLPLLYIPASGLVAGLFR